MQRGGILDSHDLAFRLPPSEPAGRASLCFDTMEHRDAVPLIAAAVGRGSGVWADLGAGTGTFTRALADLLAARSRIYAVDRDARAVRAVRSVKAGDVDIVPVYADFPIAGTDFRETAAHVGLVDLTMTATRPSAYAGTLYAAAAERDAPPTADPAS